MKPMAEARREGLYSIGEAAERAGVSVKMARYYESIGLMPRAKRTEGGYRLYGENEVHQLVFIRRARALGFSIEEIEQLLALWRNKRRASAQVKRLALRHVDELEGKIAVLLGLNKGERVVTQGAYQLKLQELQPAEAGAHTHET